MKADTHLFTMLEERVKGDVMSTSTTIIMMMSIEDDVYW